MQATEPSAPAVRVAPIIAALLLGALGGWAAGPETAVGSLKLVEIFDFLGALFLNLLKMLIVPLVTASIIASLQSMRAGRELGRVGLRTLGLYVLTTLVAVLIAVPIVNIVEPGLVDGAPAREALALQADTLEVASGVRERASASVFDLILGVVPTNVIMAAGEQKLLSLVFFSVLFGVFLTRVAAPLRDTVSNFWEGVLAVMTGMTGMVMRIAPLGVFGLTASVVAESGLAAARPLLAFAGCVLAGLLFYVLIALPVLLRVLGRVNPWRLFTAMAPALLSAFATASSAATLPISMSCVESRARVSSRITRFVMPLGTSANHAGSALYECAGALFLAQAYGLALSPATQVVVVLLALLTSMGIAGVPAASLIAIAVILAAVGLPAEGVGVLLALDRVLDMARTAVNVFADAACAVIVARLEGEQAVLQRAATGSHDGRTGLELDGPYDGQGREP